MILASPANPTGTIIPPAELAAIAALCRERGIGIISDEIYHGLSYGGPTHSMLEFEPDADIISSFSKYFSMAGWRLGWLLVPHDHVARANAYASNLFLTAPSLSQHAALAAMDARDELDGHVAVYTANRDRMLAALPSFGLTAIAPPDGAFYIYADIGHLTDDSVSFCWSCCVIPGLLPRRASISIRSTGIDSSGSVLPSLLWRSRTQLATAVLVC